MKTFWLDSLIIFLLVVFSATPMTGNDLASRYEFLKRKAAFLLEEKNSLKAEEKLSSQGKYLIIDIRDKKVLAKWQGRKIKEFEIKSYDPRLVSVTRWLPGQKITTLKRKEKQYLEFNCGLLLSVNRFSKSFPESWSFYLERRDLEDLFNFTDEGTKALVKFWKPQKGGINP